MVAGINAAPGVIQIHAWGKFVRRKILLRKAPI
jgi:hypothetical protein